MAQPKQKRTRITRVTTNLIIGVVLTSLIALVGVLGPLFVNPKMARVGAVKPNLPPSSESFFGTDSQGRDVFTTLVKAIPSTLKIGVIAGIASVVLGLILGLMAGFFGGWADWIIRTFSDVLMAVPSVAFMILVVARMDRPNINLVAFIVALLTWPGTARGIRSQVLTIRERSYTAVARANGESEIEVLFREVMPNLLPLMMASFIGAVTAGIYTVMALEVLGLGNNTIPTLGMMIFWSQRFSSVLRGMWWWWSPPIITIAGIFVGLFMLSTGLDRFVNPTLATAAARWQNRPSKKASDVKVTADGGAILDVRNLKVVYETNAGLVRAVDDVSFKMMPGQRMGLIGESGSGKTTMATALMILSKAPARIESGEIFLEGKDMLSMSNEELRKLRLKEIALMPQSSMNSLNPVVRIEPQIKDAIITHMGRMSDDQLNKKVFEVLAKVGLRPEVVKRFPHQLSGGMKQRVAMAIGITLSPKIIIADEPTSALDVVVQQQVMATLGRLQGELNAAVLLIGHDMGLITQFSDVIGVLYAGKLVEWGDVQQLLENPYHPYTRLLIDSLPTLDGKKELVGIPGLPPELLKLPPGCAFHPRCPFAFERCRSEIPAVQTLLAHRQVACHLYPDRKTLPPYKARAGVAVSVEATLTPQEASS